jgi:hypothetical protein
MRKSRHAKGAILAMISGLCWFGMVAGASSQRALCPASPMFSSSEATTDVSLQGGLCTNSGTPEAMAPQAAGGFPTGAFSGAALATQALTELTQSTTRETTRSLQDSITNRRRDEMELCAAGFTLVGGRCRTGRSLARPGATEAAEPLQPEPAVRFAGWTALYGDYERRSVQGSASFAVGAWGGGTIPLDVPISVRTRTGSVGFSFGADATTRGVIFPDDGLIAGLALGALTGDATIGTSSGPSSRTSASPALGATTSITRATFSGLTAAGYLVYFNGGFSSDLLLKADLSTLQQSFDDALSFTNPREGQPPLTSVFSGAGRFALLATTIAGNLNYRFIVDPNLWIEPTVGAFYTHSTYGNGAAAFGLDDGDLVTVQGGARVGLPILIGRTLITTTLTGLAYSDVLVAGGFVPGASFLPSNLLAKADEGQIRGRGIIAVGFDFGNGVTSFIQGEARGGKGLFGAGGRAGIRIVW